MKPLTIEELKALEVGDWVWIEKFSKHLSQKFYAQKIPQIYNTEFAYDSVHEQDYVEYEYYGTAWFAYKNKEQAEAKGKIVELPIRSYKDVIYYDEDFKCVSKNGIVVERYTYEKDAERRFAELKNNI